MPVPLSTWYVTVSYAGFLCRQAFHVNAPALGPFDPFLFYHCIRDAFCLALFVFPLLHCLGPVPVYGAFFLWGCPDHQRFFFPFPLVVVLARLKFLTQSKCFCLSHPLPLATLLGRFGSSACTMDFVILFAGVTIKSLRIFRRCYFPRLVLGWDTRV